jgi:RHS repeat-associated protein
MAARNKLTTAECSEDILRCEADGAQAYWKAWHELPIMYPRVDVLRVPDHWKKFGSRMSALTQSPRLAVNPPNAMLNYLYALLESEARLAVAALGLDPGIGVLHKDTRTRDSLANDVLEPVRPQVDSFLLDWLTKEPLRRQWFLEERNGNCRLMSSLAARLSETGAIWRRAVAPFAEGIARALHRQRTTDSQGLATRLTQDRKREAKGIVVARRGLSSQRANGVDALTVDYSSGTSLPTLMDSAGNLTNYTAGTQLGNRKYITNIQGGGCDSCMGRNTQTFTYDAGGNRITAKDPNNNQTTYSYDASGNVTQIRKPIGSSTQTWNYTWNSFGEPLTATDPLGKVTTNTYDTKGNLLTTKTPLGNTTTFTYDAKGELLTIKDPRLNVTTLTYTPAGLVATIKDAQNKLTQFQYDARGNRTVVIDALNQTTSFTYDSMNRLKKITYPTTPATSVQFDYDYRGRRTTVTDANSKITTYGYDDADRLVSVTDANTQVTGYAYDSENNLTQITDAATNKTSFVYDNLGRLKQTAFPSTLAETYGYDSNGNLTNKIDRNGHSISYTFDQLDRLAQKSYPDSTSVSYTYDLANHLTQAVDPTGTYGFTFDADGRLTQTSTVYSFVPGRTFTVGYGYDAAANRTSMTDPQNAATSYVYDTLNRLTSLASPQGTFGFNYDVLSRRSQLTRSNSITTTYGYDPMSRLLSVLHKLGATTLDGATYTTDCAGNRTSKTDQRTGTATNFGYDSIYRLLTAAQSGSTTESYTYDPVGNRLTSLAGSYANNGSNELTSSPTASFTYDNNGNTLSKTDSTGTTSYAWDFENRLTSVTLPGAGGTVTFRYDPLGRRIQKFSANATTNYLYDSGNLFEEVDSSGNLLARYTQTLNIDEPLAILRSGVTSFYNADGLGSITSLANSSGTLAQTYTFDSFGKLIAATGSVTNSFQYTAREFDTETGLYFYRARYMDSSTGRFISEDPIGFRGGGPDFYVYASQNPTIHVDPSGSNYCKYKRCLDLFEKVFPRFTREGLDAVAASTPVLFQDASFSGLTKESLVGPVGNWTDHLTLNQILGNANATTLHGPWGPAVLVSSFWPFRPGRDPDATLLHELALHAYQNQPDDAIYTEFSPFGLKRLFSDSVDITAWISTDCKTTPPRF